MSDDPRRGIVVGEPPPDRSVDKPPALLSLPDERGTRYQLKRTRADVVAKAAPTHIGDREVFVNLGESRSVRTGDAPVAKHGNGIALESWLNLHGR